MRQVPLEELDQADRLGLSFQKDHVVAVWSAEWAAAGTVVTAVYQACVVCLAWADPLHARLV